VSLRWSEEQLGEYLQRQTKLDEIGAKHGLTPKTPKFRNQKVTIDGVTYDSKKEAARHQQLLMMEKAGKITELSRQVPFELAPAVVLNGRKKPPLRYWADHVYKQDGVRYVEDVKSEITRKEPLYRAKIHLLKHLYNIDVTEV
jgi:hypothetical protein